MNKQIFNIPNCITILRIIGTASLIFITPLSVPFFIIYTVSGISDVLDGTIARLTKNETTFGKRLDSIADLAFYAVMLIKIFPIFFEKFKEFENICIFNINCDFYLHSYLSVFLFRCCYCASILIFIQYLFINFLE